MQSFFAYVPSLFWFIGHRLAAYGLIFCISRMCIEPSQFESKASIWHSHNVSFEWSWMFLTVHRPSASYLTLLLGAFKPQSPFAVLVLAPFTFSSQTFVFFRWMSIFPPFISLTLLELCPFSLTRFQSLSSIQLGSFAPPPRSGVFVYATQVALAFFDFRLFYLCHFGFSFAPTLVLFVCSTIFILNCSTSFVLVNPTSVALACECSPKIVPVSAIRSTTTQFLVRVVQSIRLVKAIFFMVAMRMAALFLRPSPQLWANWLLRWLM